MNQEDFNRGIEDLRSIKLTADEKRAMLEHIFNAPIESPYARVFVFARHHLAAIFALCLMLSIGTLTYAAGNALPGDALYAVKTRMVEPVIGQLRTLPEERVAWEEERVSRRLEEAEALIEEDELDEEKAQVIERKIERASAAFVQAVEEAAIAATSSPEAQEEKRVKLKEELRKKVEAKMREASFDDEDKKEDVREKKEDKEKENIEKVERIKAKVFKALESERGE